MMVDGGRWELNLTRVIYGNYLSGRFLRSRITYESLEHTGKWHMCVDHIRGGWTGER